MLLEPSRGDVVLRRGVRGWLVADASGRCLCETLENIGEARLVGRTLVVGRGRVWLLADGTWSLLDED